MKQQIEELIKEAEERKTYLSNNRLMFELEECEYWLSRLKEMLR